MGLKKPYYRITRPGVRIYDYCSDKRYAPNKTLVQKSYINLEKSLRNIFNYIEPSECNKKVFSLELYTILLRACTAFESNSKDILIANNYKNSRDNNSDIDTITRKWNINDYKKIEKSSKLSKYKLKYSYWRSTEGKTASLTLQPFTFFDKNFKSSSDGSDVCGHNWYNDYNTVKHNCEQKFHLANMMNCLNAVGANLILLHSQFGNSCLGIYNNNKTFFELEGDDTDYDFNMDTIFVIVQ